MMARVWAGAIAMAMAITLSGGVAAEEPGFRFEVEARNSIERLTGGRADWRNAQLDWQARNAARQTYYGSLRATERFSLDDREFMVGTYQPFGTAWGMQVEAVVSPTHRVLAKNSLLAQIERRFEGGWGVQAGYRRSAFESTGTDLMIGTVDKYLSSFRVAYSLYVGRPDGAGFSPSHRLQWAYNYTDNSFFGISVNSGRETENILPRGVLVTQVSGFTISGRHEFAPGWAASYEWLSQRQGDLYTRRGFGLGIRHAF